MSPRSQALRWLSQRDYSRAELKSRLQRWLQARAEAQPAAPTLDETGLDGLLDALEAAGHLSDERFTQGRIHARQARFGNRRILHELRQCGAAADPAALEQLAASELQRAQQVRQRRFGPQLPQGASQWAQQARFLAGRGFSMHVVQQVLKPPRD